METGVKSGRGLAIALATNYSNITISEISQAGQQAVHEQLIG